MKKKRILSFMLAAFVSVTSMGFAAGNTATEGVGNVKYSFKNGLVTASVDVTAQGAERTLVLRSYKNGIMSEINVDRKTVSGTETLSATVSSGVDTARACVLDAAGNAISPDATYGADSLALKYIKIDGKEISDYSDDVNVYDCKASKNSVIEVVPQDGTTGVAFSDIKIPGTNTITVTSSRGYKRKISLILYEKAEDRAGLISLSYKIGDTVYPVTLVPGETEYSIELPENTMSVRLLPNAFGEVSIKLYDEVVTSINDVSLGTMLQAASDGYSYGRNAVNGFVPIKSEKATANIYVAYNGEETKYTIKFKAKQPRITEINYVGAESDGNKPMFVGGSAINNDNGTILGMDRRWSMANASKKLLGASMFMLPMTNRAAGQWWNDTDVASGEYFNFKADTAGTVCVLTGDTISNDYYADGWKKASGSVSLPDGQKWITVDKTWNDYDAEYFASALEYSNNNERAIDPGVAETTEDAVTLQYNKVMQNSASRHFEAGETVSIHHTGTKGNNACKMIVAIIWDGVTTTSMYESEGNSGEEEHEVISPILPPISGGNSDAVYSASFQNNSNAIIPSGGAQLPDMVKSAINSNAVTIQFELYSIDAASNSYILTSGNNIFSLYKKGNGAMYLKWAGLALAAKMPTVAAENAVGKVHTITVEKNEGTYTIKWYLDGVLESTKTSTTEKTVDSMILGSAATSGEVKLKKISIYNKILTSQEMTNTESSEPEEPVIIKDSLSVHKTVSKDMASVMVLDKKEGGENYTIQDVEAAIASGDKETLNKAVLYFTHADAKNGKIAVNIPMLPTIQAGYYDVYVNGELLTAYFVKESDKTAAKDDIIASGTIENDQVAYFVEDGRYETFKNKAKVAAFANELLAKETGTLSEAAIIDAVNKASVIEALNENAVTDFGELESIAELSPIPMSVADSIKATAEKTIIAAVSGKNFASLDDYSKAIAEAIYTNIINDTQNLTGAEKRSIFEAYAAAVGMNLSKYNRLTANGKLTAITKLQQAGLTDFSTMKTELNSICDGILSSTPISGGGGGGGGGGSVAPEKNTTAVIPAVQNAPKTQIFTDLSGYSWAQTAIESLYNLGIISGYGDNTFEPQNTVNRAEFVTMIVKKYLSDKAAEGGAFKDVLESDWYFAYVMKAYSAGIVSGMQNGLFSPKGNISRQDMATILYNVAELLGKTSGGISGEFVDSDTISDYARDKVSFLKGMGIISGDENGAFRPFDNATRAEAAQMIYKFIQLID